MIKDEEEEDIEEEVLKSNNNKMALKRDEWVETSLSFKCLLLPHDVCEFIKLLFFSCIWYICNVSTVSDLKDTIYSKPFLKNGLK